MTSVTEFANYVNYLAGSPRQWVAWNYQHIPGKDKPKKPPVDPKSGRAASPTDPATWGSYAEALAYAQDNQLPGVGLVLTPALGLSLVDLDNCFDGDGTLLPWAAAIVARFDSYTEYSPSGKGLHIYVWGAVVALKSATVEIYSAERYTTVTGRPYGPVMPIRQAQAELDALRAEYAPTEQATPFTPPPSGKISDDPLIQAVIDAERHPATAAAPVDASDEAVIEVLCRDSKQAARWAGNITGNRSSHLFGLINGLIWLCGQDQIRIERLVRQSGLYDAKRHEKNSGGGHSNLSVSVRNAIATWRGTPYKWPIVCENLLFHRQSDPPQPVEDKPPEPESEPTLTDKLNAARFWLRYGGLPVMTKGRTHDTDQAVADALIEIAIERERIDDLAIGLEEMRRRAGLGSTSTVRKALNRLSWLVARVEDGDRITRADRYSLNVGAIDWAVELALAPDSPICRKSHDGNNLQNNIMRSATNGGAYSAHRADDCFSTGGGGVGVAWGNQLPGAGKLLLLLVDIMQRDGLPMTGAQLAEATGRRYRAVCDALARGFALGLLEREQESGAGVVRRFWYSVPADWAQRAALVAVDMRTYGRGVDKAAKGALGLWGHADRLLNLDERDKARGSLNELISGRALLDDAQRETLKAWRDLADLEFKGLCQIADVAKTLDKAAIKEKIAAGAAGPVRNSRALQAARLFSGAILPGEKLSIKQRVRLFRQWAGVNGYPDLACSEARITVGLALKTVRHAWAPAPKRERVGWADLQASKQAEQAAAFERRYGVQMPAQVAA